METMEKFKLCIEMTNICLFGIPQYKYEIEFIEVQQLYKNVP